MPSIISPCDYFVEMDSVGLMRGFVVHIFNHLCQTLLSNLLHMYWFLPKSKSFLQWWVVSGGWLGHKHATVGSIGMWGHHRRYHNPIGTFVQRWLILYEYMNVVFNNRLLLLLFEIESSWLMERLWHVSGCPGTTMGETETRWRGSSWGPPCTTARV